MKILNKLLLTVVFAAIPATISAESGPLEKTVTFRFIPGRDAFYAQLGDNDRQLGALYELVERYRSQITGGQIPIHVDAYCTSQPTHRANINTAFYRANRVKSELITNKGLLEEHFRTTNRAQSYEGHGDIVVVTLRIPMPPIEVPEVKQVPAIPPPPVVDQVPQQPTAEVPAIVTEPARGRFPYAFALRTNLLYDAMLVPTVGAEWRVNPSLGVGLDGSYSFWGGESGKVQKIWLVSPGVRWYMGTHNRFYVGVAGSVGKYNSYGFLLGSFYPESEGYDGHRGDTGYQGTLWNAGLTVGYQLYLSRSFSLDFNLGLGYTRLEYDSFNMIDGVRVFRLHDKTRNLWGPTQAGVSLVWTIGN